MLEGNTEGNTTCLSMVQRRGGVMHGWGKMAVCSKSGAGV